MKFSNLLNLALITVGAFASVKTLRRRAEWERGNNRAYIVFDYDDALAVCTRARLSFSDFLCKLRDHGATHVSLPELTLDRLMREGRIATAMPALPEEGLGSRGWAHLASPDLGLLQHIAAELSARNPSTQARTISNLQPHGGASQSPVTTYHLLSLHGHLPTLSEMGLGFETSVAAEILNAGLGLVPRPVSFAWPEDHLVKRTLAQVAGLGAEIVAFDGDIILGHEMHLDTTVACLERFGLTFAYFCETRHQKGDWFLAKRLAPRGQVVLAHYFTPQAMIPEDGHSAAHHWGMLARARGIRLCYVNAFRRIHAAEPLECLHYVEHIREELEEIGLTLCSPSRPKGAPTNGNGARVLQAPDRASLALTSLATAGAVSIAASETLGLPEPAALGLSVMSAAGAMALPYLDRPRGPLEESYPPSYAPKLLALAGATAAPLAAASLGGDPPTALAGSAVVQAGTAAALAAFTTGQDYQQRIEEYRSLNTDLFLPLGAAIASNLQSPISRFYALAGLGATWYAANRLLPDVLGFLDRDLPASHTHHLSAAQRLIGDALMALGPRPARKWAGLGLAGIAIAAALRADDHKNRPGRLIASIAGTLGNAAMLAAFRCPERPLRESFALLDKSLITGAVVGAMVACLSRAQKS